MHYIAYASWSIVYVLTGTTTNGTWLGIYDCHHGGGRDCSVHHGEYSGRLEGRRTKDLSIALRNIIGIDPPYSVPIAP